MALASRPLPATTDLGSSAPRPMHRAIPAAPLRAPPPPPVPSSATSQHSSSYSSSPHHLPSDITDAIPEESGEESGSDSVVEPVTPISGGRYSQDFTAVHHDFQHPVLQRDSTFANQTPTTLKTTPTELVAQHVCASPTSYGPGDVSPVPPIPSATPASEQANKTPQSRRLTKTSSSSRLRRTVSSFFRRSSSSDKEKESSGADTTSLSTTSRSSRGSNNRPSLNADCGFSSKSTRSSSPPSPHWPLEMIPSHRSMTPGPLPNTDDFKKKGRATTGLTLRGRAVNFVGGAVGRGRPAKAVRRASSFDAGNNRQYGPSEGSRSDDEKTIYPPERLPWALAPDAGVGVKARRMSLSLPNNFNIDVADLLTEFEYQHKLLGRHGKHLGKGIASKVTLMTRRGSPGELYAVKEFRGRSRAESGDEYENKIKSEFSIGKSLHHPNIVETIRLCQDPHGRWNHVMEYCSEGDLFGLVSKGYLKSEERRKDRLCLFKQLIQGVNYLHANGIAHRDIKLENLLITKDSKLKIADFGVSEVFSGMHPGLREAGGQCGQSMGEIRLCPPGICGSEPYIAPEVLAKKDEYDPRAIDVWSSGVVLVYLWFGGCIWARAEPGYSNYDRLSQGWDKWYQRHPEEDASITDTDYPKYLPFDAAINPPALRRLALQMLNPNPHKRIPIDQVLNNRWMRNVECCQMESYDDIQVIDASKKGCCSKSGSKKILCHNHLPNKTAVSHSLGKMPGQPGY
ncbi:hypothetical protein HIM_01490 [Hirsutella minnesotensis 3608]|nr:hypothetical protein HIM_01490 [Hirsutella minnesotensis 3608]